MIESGVLEIGTAYSIRGTGVWGEWHEDLVVVSTIDPTQIDILNVDLFTDFFQAYGLTEKLYNSTISEVSEIYRCKVLGSRDPGMDISGAKDVFLFNQFIDWNESEELVKCKSYNFTVASAPYKDGDIDSPEDIEEDVARAIQNGVRGIIYDAFSIFNNTTEIYITKSEYEGHALEREYNKAMYQTTEAQVRSTTERLRNTMISATKDADTAKETYASKAAELDKQVSLMTVTNNTLNNQVTEYSTKLIRLKEVYSRVVEIANNYNSKVTPSEQIQVPNWNDLLSSSGLL